MFLLPFALAGLLAYVIAYPLVLIWALHARRDIIYKDRMLHCMGFDDDAVRVLDKDAAAMRANFGRMYTYFRPDTWYWVGILLARKGALALCVVAMTSTPAF